MKVYQDGATFYDDSTGNVIFTASIRVTDYDLDAANKARAEFLEWAGRVKGLRHHQIAFV